jgi:hypothetical protein
MLTLLILSVLWGKRRALREKLQFLANAKMPKLGVSWLKKNPAL